MTDAAYQEVIDRVEDWIETVTKHEWVSTDKDIAAIRGIAEMFAAVDVRRRFNEDDKEADRLEKSANERLRQFIATSDYATKSRSYVNVPMAFRSWPMNPNARPFTGLKKGRLSTARKTLNFVPGDFVADDFEIIYSASPVEIL